MTDRLELAGVIAGALAAGWASAWCAGRYGAGPKLRALLIATMPAVALSALIGGTVAGAVWGWMLGWTLLTLAVIDGVALRLPDVLTLPLAALGLGEAVMNRTALGVGADLESRVIGLTAGLLAFGALAWLYARVRGRSGLGGGDVKLLAAAGAWVGVAALPILVLSACGTAAAMLLGRALFQGSSSLKRPFPFGVALAAATWGVWLVQRLEGSLA